MTSPKLRSEDGHARAAQQRAAVQKTLTHWKQGADLASVRDTEPLAKLPEADREAWQKLWADVDTLLTKVRADK